MIKLFRLFGIGGKIAKKAAKPNRTAAFADYKTALRPAPEKIIPPLKYDYRAQIPAAYTTPEFRSYMSLSVLQKKKAYKIRVKKLKAEQKRQEELAKESMFNNHEDIVAQIINTEPRFLKKTQAYKKIKELSDPDMCLELLDYDGFRLTDKNRSKVVANNILLRQIAKGGKSVRRTDALLERLKNMVALSAKFYPHEEKHEVKELVNTILRIGEEPQLHSMFKVLRGCAGSDSYSRLDFNGQVLCGVAKAAREIDVPTEFAQLGEVIIRKPVKTWAASDAAVELSYFKGKFDLISELMTQKDYWAQAVSRTQRVVSAGFRSALKDGRLDEFREIVLNPENKYLLQLISNTHKARTPGEDVLFKQEITSRLLDKKYLDLFYGSTKQELFRELGCS